jgi:hypothetical protein
LLEPPSLAELWLKNNVEVKRKKTEKLMKVRSKGGKGKKRGV